MSYLISHPDIEGSTAEIPERALAAYARKGWLLEGRTDQATPAAEAKPLEQPNRSDSAAAWKTYAVALSSDEGGLDYDTAIAMTRDELADHFNPKPARATAKTAPAVTTTQES